MKRIHTILGIAAITVIQGCSVINFGYPVTPTPIIGSENGIPESPILFQDDSAKMEAVGRPWFPPRDPLWHTLTRDLNSSIMKPKRISGQPGRGEYANIAVGVDGSKLGGPDDNTFGVICRYVDTGNFYAFLIGSDGYFGIIKVKDGVYSLLSGSSMDYSPSIVRGTGTNRMLGVCSEDELGLFVNGDLLTIVQDSDFTQGRMV